MEVLIYFDHVQNSIKKGQYLVLYILPICYEHLTITKIFKVVIFSSWASNLFAAYCWMWNFFLFVFIVGVFGDFALSFQHTHTEYEGFDSLCPISLSFKGRKTSIFGICSEILVKDKLRGQSILSSGSGSNFFWKCRIWIRL